MPTPQLSAHAAEEAVALVDSVLREGFRPQGVHASVRSAVEVAAERAVQSGVVNHPTTFRKRLETALRLYGLEPDWGLWRPRQYQQPQPRAALHPAAPPEPALLRPDGAPQRVLAIPDLHQCPRHPHRLACLTWIARFASERRFDRIVQLGDWSTNDSVSRHDKNDTRKARLKPFIRDDLDNLVASHRAFRLGMADGYRPKLDVVLGNHEHRLETFENITPEAYGVHTGQRDEAFLQFGWRTRPYGEILYLNGVGFTHHPVNGAGRAYGGKTGPQRAANDALVPIVSGHTHRRQVHDCPKIGGHGVISMVEAGCAMPWGEVEDYAALSPLGWWWGVVSLTVWSGQITDLEFVSMLALRDRYSDEGGDAKTA